MGECYSSLALPRFVERVAYFARSCKSGDAMTEAEWLAATGPTTMLAAIRGSASDRKFYLLAVACTCRMCSLTAEGVNAFAAFEEAADFLEPRLAMIKARERFPANWGFEREPWDIAGISARGPVISEGPMHGPHLIRDIFGNPFRPVAFDPNWRTSTAVALATQMYESRDFAAMPILADALQDAGCDNTNILDHCRDAAVTHVRGCWVVDLVLGKE
jgi:hypothetical protein